MKCGILALALLAAVPAVVVAQAYPVKAIRWIVPYPPGGSFDGFSRVRARHPERSRTHRRVMVVRSSDEACRGLRCRIAGALARAGESAH